MHSKEAFSREYDALLAEEQSLVMEKYKLELKIEGILDRIKQLRFGGEFGGEIERARRAARDAGLPMFDGHFGRHGLRLVSVDAEFILLRAGMAPDDEVMVFCRITGEARNTRAVLTLGLRRIDPVRAVDIFSRGEK